MMPYILSVIGVTALWFIGRGYWWGWLMAWGNECLWVGFAIVTRQHGFILGSLVYGTINIINAIDWRRNVQKEKKPSSIR